MPFVIWGMSDVGRIHSVNDDCVFPVGMWPAPFAVDPAIAELRGQLMAVADGVSSARHGALASARAVESLVERFYDAQPMAPSIATASEMTIEARLIAAVGAANAAARAVAETSENEFTAATTLVALALHHNQAWVAHVGDSRAYWIHRGRAELLTNDHSVVQELLSAGAITPAEALVHPDQGALTRALGITDHLSVDLCGPVTLDIEDRLVLCSDGLTTLVGADEIGGMAATHPPAEAAHRLIDLANKRGGYDNVSVVIAGPDAPKPRAHWLHRLIRR